MVFGHAPTADEILGSFSNPGAAFAAKFFQTILYSISNVIFASNLLSGLFILITMSFSAPFPSVLLGILSLLSGLFTCLWIVRFPREMTIRGGITFNCFLVGSLLSPLTGLKTSSILSHEMIYLIPMALAVGAFT
jgi:urea transporter